MLPTERPDYRRSRETELLAALRARDPLALAEAYHRTAPAAHACARRLLGNARDAEALLRLVYAELWDSPPEIARLEGWVRSRCFHVGTKHLREHDEPPASPSLALLLPDLPAPEQAPHDPAEQALAALPEPELRAVLLAHDQGMPTTAQDDPDASAALERALLALAGPGEGVDDGSAHECTDVAALADWTLGLLEAEHAARVAAAVADRPPCAARCRGLRRGRRRMEGLPPAPDMGQRVLAVVLAAGPGAPVEHAPAAAARPSPTAPPAAPARVAPASSLGDAPPASAIPAAPLPSALDPEPTVADHAAPASDQDDAPAVGGGQEPAADAPATDAGAHDGHGADEAAAGSFAAADTEALRLSDLEEDDVQPAVVEADDEALAEVATEGGRRRRGRQVLNVLAIIVVLAAGGLLGLFIGFLLVR